MADNYLITGYWGEPHVTAENDRGINAAIFGTGRFVLPVGKQFKAEYIGNNTIRLYDGKLLDNGAAAGIPAGRYVDLLIPEAGQGMNRNDLIVFQYKKDASTMVESGAFVVVSGTETEGTAEDPALTQEDLLSDEATFDQMALWRVPVSASAISTPVQLFDVSKNLGNAVGGDRIVEATSTDGEVYYATLDGVEKLYTGLGIIIIPDTESAATSPALNVGLGLDGVVDGTAGQRIIRRRASNSTATRVSASDKSWIGANVPLRLMFDGSFWVADFIRPNANDLYGTVPVEKGGTGGTTSETARKNLQVAQAIELSGIPGCYYRFFDDVREDWNPAMWVDNEYRTTERWLGKPVYTKLVQFNGPSANSNVVYEFTDEQVQPIRIAGCSSNGWVLPYLTRLSDGTLGTYAGIRADGFILNCESNYDCSSHTWTVQVWYVKN